MLFKQFFYVFIISLTSLVHAGSIVVIQGDHTHFGQKYFAGFSSLVKHKVLAYKYDNKSELSLMGKVSSLRPDLIMTIGAVPLKKFSDRFPSTPIIASDYYDPKLKAKSNVLLLDESQPIEHIFNITQIIMGRPITWGVIYDPKYSQIHYENIKNIAKKMGVKVLAVKADKIIDIKSTLPAFKNKIDAFLQLRDITINHAGASDAIAAFCRQNNIALVSLNPHASTKHTPLLSASIDPIVLGEKAYTLANAIIATRIIPKDLEKYQKHTEIISTLSMGQLSLMGLSESKIINLLNTLTNQGIRIVLSQ